MTVHNKNCKNHYYDGEEIIAVKIGGFCIDQRTTYLPAAGGWNSTYTFSGKEKDKESGYSYFGARYYNADLSIWLSVDPRAGSYPAVTPYNYCANSPVMYRDPNGEWINFVIGGLSGAFSGWQMGHSLGAKGGEMACFIILGAGIGAFTSGIGAIVGDAISGVMGGVTGFLPCFVSNAVSAAVSTTISSSSMAWISGSSFGEGLAKGFIDGQIAGLMGGAIGGLSGGISASMDGRNFWTGSFQQYDLPINYVASTDNNAGYEQYSFPDNATVANADSKRVYYKSEKGITGMSDFVEPGKHIIT